MAVPDIANLEKNYTFPEPYRIAQSTSVHVNNSVMIYLLHIY